MHIKRVAEAGTKWQRMHCSQLDGAAQTSVLAAAQAAEGVPGAVAPPQPGGLDASGAGHAPKPPLTTSSAGASAAAAAELIPAGDQPAGGSTAPGANGGGAANDGAASSGKQWPGQKQQQQRTPQGVPRAEADRLKGVARRGGFDSAIIAAPALLPAAALAHVLPLLAASAPFVVRLNPKICAWHSPATAARTRARRHWHWKAHRQPSLTGGCPHRDSCQGVPYLVPAPKLRCAVAQVWHPHMQPLAEAMASMQAAKQAVAMQLQVLAPSVFITSRLAPATSCPPLKGLPACLALATFLFSMCVSQHGSFCSQ